MNPRSIMIFAAFAGAWLPWAAVAQETRWRLHSFELENFGTVEWQYPVSWGKEPEIQTGENVTVLRFGPYGPKAKPEFMVVLNAQPAIADSVTDEQLKGMLEGFAEALKSSAQESEIPLNKVTGKNAFGYYFSMTDRESKWGEFDYLTQAGITSGRLVLTFQFLSSDGAPDFGADAIRAMESVKFVPTPPK